MRQHITMNKQKNLISKEAFELFLRKCRVRNLSEQTLKTYQVHFEIWSRFYPVTKHINEVTTETIENFILYLHDTNFFDVFFDVLSIFCTLKRIENVYYI